MRWKMCLLTRYVILAERQTELERRRSRWWRGCQVEKGAKSQECEIDPFACSLCHLQDPSDSCQSTANILMSRFRKLDTLHSHTHTEQLNIVIWINGPQTFESMGINYSPICNLVAFELQHFTVLRNLLTLLNDDDSSNNPESAQQFN